VHGVVRRNNSPSAAVNSAVRVVPWSVEGDEGTMGEVTTKLGTKRRRDQGGSPPPAQESGGDVLSDPLSGGTVQALGDPLAGDGNVVQFDDKNGPIEGADTTLTLLGVTPNAKAVTSFAAELHKISGALNKSGDDILFDDRELLAASATVLDWAKKTTELGNGVTNWIEKAIDMRKRATLADPLQDTNRVGGPIKAMGDAQKVLIAANAFTKLTSTEKMNAFLADIENKKAREAWATEVTTVFDELGKLIPDSISGTPMTTPLAMFKGYLSAPKNYLRAFRGILDSHLGDIDKKAGIDNYSIKVLSGGTIDWGGPLTMLYVNASSNRSVHGLAGFMKKTHRRLLKDSKINLWNASMDVGLGLVLAEIETRAPNPETKDAWLNFVRDPDNRS
jgi:hypothetical protein